MLYGVALAARVTGALEQRRNPVPIEVILASGTFLAGQERRPPSPRARAGVHIDVIDWFRRPPCFQPAAPVSDFPPGLAADQHQRHDRQMPDASDPVIQRQRLSFGAAVRARRTSLGMSQEALAAKARWSRQSIVRIETATHSPHLDRVFILADILGVSLAELFAEDRSRQRRGDGRLPGRASISVRSLRVTPRSCRASGTRDTGRLGQPAVEERAFGVVAYQCQGRPVRLGGGPGPVGPPVQVGLGGRPVVVTAEPAVERASSSMVGVATAAGQLDIRARSKLYRLAA